MNREEFFHFVAGGTGGTVSAFVTCPLEVVKTRLQSSNSGFQRPESGSTRSAGPVTASTTGPSHGGVSPAAPTAAQGSRHHHYRPHPPTHHSHSISTTTTTTPGGGAHSKLIMPDFAAPSRSVTTVPSSTTFNVRYTGSSSSSKSSNISHLSGNPRINDNSSNSSSSSGGGGGSVSRSSTSGARSGPSSSSRGQILRQCRAPPGWFQTWAVNYFSTTAHVNQCVGVPPNRVQPTMGVFQCLRYIKRTEGWTGLYRGLGPNLVGVIPARSIYFYSYNRAKRTVNGSMPKGYRDTPFVHLISAGVGGFCSATATNPLWLVKTRLQLDRSCGNNSLTFTRCTINIYNTLGFFGFWKGVTASYWGISETMINFVIYEYLKKMWAEYQESHPELANHWFYSSWFIPCMVCASVSKCCASCLTYPHEVARTRLREDGHKYRSFWQTLRTVFHEEGRRGLYRGLVTQMVRQIPNTAVLMGTYELTVDLLGRYFSTKSEDNPQHEKTSAG
ncbi:solute carrier family 25 member 36-like [Tigriopus californicus]|uniref:solute carrier family 25 member 36-like n=1 Tax=Tigriopus californicus TaxID=6832 RepID=UPI0027D9E1F1|nr:solute carrier family 25 member 36-like [Tigriopus californicus]XP_059085880.1 solute carrier family 25 member 36-like [Tigriopus californicus]XP_059085881.1 solute carrier family 25 member 36-like [Tigriopus californicus]XP_059085882.1 solute carrier family 25 member 36-like [Tigriopus californicus]